ncbi:Fanconi anemia core complex-associated protein 20 [Excalfactoria chinensis]|uniref:Fanconi anemia core complex-associated protein 20 n=1 Tax=Excalfactoria chinensis TaxID=46218 RepID=UPI003B3B51A1
MAEEGAAKLRLRAKKAPTALSRESSTAPQRRASTDRSSWFENNDLNECEKTWSLLLRNISQDLQCTSWQTVPSFPEFFSKSSEEENLQKEEVFKIGMKDFCWTPFPPFPKEQHFKPDFSSPQLIETQLEHLHEEWDQADELKSLPSASEQTCCNTNTDSPPDMAGEDTGGVSKADVDLKPFTDTQHKTSTCHLPLPQRTVKALSVEQHCRGTVQNSKKGKQEKNELQAQTHQSSISFGESRSVPTGRKSPLVNVAGNESCKENSGQESEGSSALDSCPMCLIRFSGRLSQLDIDGHLARCLSESTDDIMW